MYFELLGSLALCEIASLTGSAVSTRARFAVVSGNLYLKLISQFATESEKV